MKAFYFILVALVAALLTMFLGTFAGCSTSAHPSASGAPSTPEQIRQAQTAVAAVKSDVAAAKKAAASVASAHEKLATAKAAVAALPTPATTEKAEAQSQIDGADDELVSADSALGVTLNSADSHTDQANDALTGAQKSAQADAAAAAKTQKQLAQTKQELKEVKAADPSKGWLEFIGIMAIVAGIALAIGVTLAESIPVVGKWLQNLGNFGYEVAALLFGAGLLLVTLAHYLKTIELVLIWSAAGAALIVAALLLRRYWATISNFIVGKGTPPATIAPISSSAAVPAAGAIPPAGQPV